MFSFNTCTSSPNTFLKTCFFENVSKRMLHLETTCENWWQFRQLRTTVLTFIVSRSPSTGGSICNSCDVFPEVHQARLEECATPKRGLRSIMGIGQTQVTLAGTEACAARTLFSITLVSQSVALGILVFSDQIHFGAFKTTLWWSKTDQGRARYSRVQNLNLSKTYGNIPRFFYIGQWMACLIINSLLLTR